MVKPASQSLIAVRRGDDRGQTNFSWLSSHHTFSFGEYFDPSFMGHGPLRVINEDRVSPGQGFGVHGHRDMEIITYVVDGALEHKDSLGVGSVLHHGDVQRMSAGTGVRHSEFNHSNSDPVHFLQIWIIPTQMNLQPSYQQQTFSTRDKTNVLRLLGSPDGRQGSLKIHQDISLYASQLVAQNTVTHTFAQGRLGWLQVISGSLDIDGITLAAGDGALIELQGQFGIRATSDAEFLLFDTTGSVTTNR